MAGEERGRAGAAPDIIDEINALLRLGVGDQYRLEHIKLAYVENRNIWESDRRYLERMREKYIDDLRRGEPVDDDRDVMAAADAAPGGAAGRPAEAQPAPDAPPPPPRADRRPPQPGIAAADAVPDPTAAPDPAPDPAPAQPGSPESAASDAEDFGAGPDGGSAGPAVIHCWKCGKKNLLKANFCMRCGVLLFDVGNARASADSAEYAASSIPPDIEKRRAAATAAPGVGRGSRRAPPGGGMRTEGGGGSRRAVLAGVAALVGILLVVAVLTSSVEIELGGEDEEVDAAGEAADSASGPPAAAAPEPEPAPEPPPP